MERAYKFSKGQRVKIRDEEDFEWVMGIVEDTTSNSVIIKWEDLHDPVQHFEDEYYKLKLL